MLLTNYKHTQPTLGSQISTLVYHSTHFMLT